MSYSRWSNSVWYTIWDARGGEKLEDQWFTVYDENTFTYAELKKLGTEACAYSCNAGSYTHEQYQELIGYMSSFMEDCELQFKPFVEEALPPSSTNDKPLRLDNLVPKWWLKYQTESMILHMNRPSMLEYLGKPKKFKKAISKWVDDSKAFTEKWKDFQPPKEEEKE